MKESDIRKEKIRQKNNSKFARIKANEERMKALKARKHEAYLKRKAEGSYKPLAKAEREALEQLAANRLAIAEVLAVQVMPAKLKEMAEVSEAVITPEMMERLKWRK